MYTLMEEQIKELSEEILKSNINRISIGTLEFNIIKGHDVSINNQGGELKYSNFFGTNLEFVIRNKNLNLPISIQLYLNDRRHYRIFVFNSKGMLTSINLSNGYENGIITFKTQLKITSSKMTKQERSSKRDLMIKNIERAGIDVEGVSTVYFGQYDVQRKKFIDSNPEKFIKNLITVAVIKGHYMENKGYEIEELDY